MLLHYWHPTGHDPVQSRLLFPKSCQPALQEHNGASSFLFKPMHFKHDEELLKQLSHYGSQTPVYS